MSSRQAEQAVFTIRQGDDWFREWTRTDGSATYTGDLLVQIRSGVDTSAALVASSDPADDVIVIDLSGTDLEGDPPTIGMLIGSVDTATLEPHGTFTIEAQCTVGGLVTTIMAHRLFVVPQVAVTA
mgnify:CR=1 FL=1